MIWLLCFYVFISNLETFLLQLRIIIHSADCNMLFLLFIEEQYLVFESFVGMGFWKSKDKTAPGEENDFKYRARSAYIPERQKNKSKDTFANPYEAIW